ncbi:MAG: hypothetical protein IMZ65_03405, partial [Planctomycetes bacterium]|nr:hypothetical protein [Planctomycetota bacterium]
MPKTRLFVLFWLIFAAASAADLAWDGSGARVRSASAQSPSLLLVGATLIDGTGAPPVENAWVRVDDGRITAVGRGDAPPSRGARVLDLRGMTVLPGLSDMHVHVQNKARGAWALKMLVAHGVTNVRDVGSPLDELRAVQDWMQTDPAVPHLTTSGVILNGNGPQGLFLMPGPKLTAQMEADLAAGARFVKSHNEVSLAGAQAIAAFAKEHDTPWMGHVPFTMTSLTAIDLGLASVEHMQVRPSEVVGDPEVVARYPIGTSSRLRDNYWAALDPGSPVLQATLAGWEKRRNRFFFDPTLVAQYNLAHGDVDPFLSQEEWDLATPLLQQQWSERGRTMPGSVNVAGWAETKVAFRKQLEFLRLAHARGVRLLTGTDFGAYREVP